MAASVPQLQFYSDNYPLYTITNDFCEHLPVAAAATSSNAAAAGALWAEEETLVPLFHEFGLDQTSSYPHPHHHVALPHQHELDNMGCGGGGAISAAGSQNLCLGYPQPPDNQFHEFGEQDAFGFGFGLLPHIKPIYHPLPTDNWVSSSHFLNFKIVGIYIIIVCIIPVTTQIKLI